MTVHKLSAGDGYTYLTRQVASADEIRAPGTGACRLLRRAWATRPVGGHGRTLPPTNTALPSTYAATGASMGERRVLEPHPVTCAGRGRLADERFRLPGLGLAAADKEQQEEAGHCTHVGGTHPPGQRLLPGRSPGIVGSDGYWLELRIGSSDRFA